MIRWDRSSDVLSVFKGLGKFFFSRSFLLLLLPFFFVFTFLKSILINLAYDRWYKSKPSPVTGANNVGTWFDGNLNLKEHINKTRKTAYFHLHNIQLITKYLSNNSPQTLLHELVMGRVDYCNSLLFGLPAVHLGKLQRVQNSAARIICNISRYDHITPGLRSLHWSDLWNIASVSKYPSLLLRQFMALHSVK